MTTMNMNLKQMRDLSLHYNDNHIYWTHPDTLTADGSGMAGYYGAGLLLIAAATIVSLVMA